MPPAADSPLTIGVSLSPCESARIASTTQESGIARKSLVSQSRMLQAAGEASHWKSSQEVLLTKCQPLSEASCVARRTESSYSPSIRI